VSAESRIPPRVLARFGPETDKDLIRRMIEAAASSEGVFYEGRIKLERIAGNRFTLSKGLGVAYLPLIEDVSFAEAGTRALVELGRGPDLVAK
jgi:hypothetical protein